MLLTYRSKKWLSRPLFIIVLFLVLFTSTQAAATDIRGRIDGQHSYSFNRFPVNGARIDLYYWAGRNWVLAGTAFSAPDGMYYMKNIPPGNYNLQVNGILNFSITVHNMRFQDIPPILIRY